MNDQTEWKETFPGLIKCLRHEECFTLPGTCLSCIEEEMHALEAISVTIFCLPIPGTEFEHTP